MRVLSDGLTTLEYLKECISTNQNLHQIRNLKWGMRRPAFTLGPWPGPSGPWALSLHSFRGNSKQVCPELNEVF